MNNTNSFPDDIPAYVDDLLSWRGSLEFNLDTIRSVMLRLDNPQDKVKTIIVAGTNGKGSVSSAVASILGASGLRTGLFTSPHLESLNERIVIDGLPIDNMLFAEMSSRVKAAAEDAGVKLSLFEGMTAIAYLCFYEAGLDYGVMEVGLGGRLDATNIVVKPELTIITSIALDHQHILGETIPLIAREKAGIIKKGVKIITGKLPEDAFDEINNIAMEALAEHISFNLGDFSVSDISNNSACYKYGKRTIQFSSSLEGRHQIFNSAVAITAAYELGISQSDIHSGLKNVFWPARLEKLKFKGKQVIIDCAHNPAGIDTLVEYLEDKQPGDIEVIFGALKGKPWKLMVDKLKSYIVNWNIVEADTSRAVEGQEISDYLSCIGVSHNSFGRNISSLLSYIESDIPDDRVVLIAGSIYISGEIRSHLLKGKEPRKLWRKKC